MKTLEYVKFTLKSNSNKQLDRESKEIIKIIRQTGCVKAGPIPFKGIRVIYCYNPNIMTFDKLMLHNPSKKVDIEVESLRKTF